MRLLLYTLNFSPELTGIGKYTGEMANWFVNKGHKVIVVTAPPYYPHWNRTKGYSKFWYTKEIIGDLVIYRCPIYVPSSPNGFSRILHLISFSISSLPIMLGLSLKRFDFVWIVEPPFFCTPTALFVSWLSSAKSWLHIQDFEIDAAFNLGLIKQQWLKRSILAFERKVLKCFDFVSSISPRMVHKAIEKGAPASKVFLFENWVDTNLIFPDESARILTKSDLLLSNESRVLLYSGNMGEKQGLEFVLEAAALLRSIPDLYFILCGDGASRIRLQADYPDLNNVIWLPLQPIDKLNGLMNAADIHILPQLKDAADLVMPSKLSGIFSSGRPVIAMADFDTTVYEVVENRGVSIKPEDSQALADAILELLSDPDRCQELGKNARIYAEEHLATERVLNGFYSLLREKL